MLTSTQVHLHSLEPGELPNTTGQFGHAAFLRLVETVSPGLSAALHDRNGRQPFTVSPLYVPARSRVNGHVHLNEGAGCSMRFTMLDPALYSIFQESFLLPQSDAQIWLQRVPFAIREVVTTPRADGWTGYTSFRQLLENAQPARCIALRFYSPTALSRGDSGNGKQFDLLPTPWGVFDSLCRKWNEFAAEPIANPKLLREWVQKHVLTADVRDLNTEILRFDRFAQKGFTGTVTYAIQSEDERMLRVLIALADFALFAGVGYKTTWGMGQARRVKE